MEVRNQVETRKSFRGLLEQSMLEIIVIHTRVESNEDDEKLLDSGYILKGIIVVMDVN